MSTTVRDVMGAVRIRVVSPDGSVRVHNSFTDGIRIACEPDDLRRHDASSLSTQLERALNTMSAGALEAQRRAVGKALGTPPSPPEDSWDARVAAERKRYGRELVDHITVVETSRNSIVVMSFHARRGFRVRVVDRALRDHDAETVLAEINETVGLVLQGYHGELAAMHETLMAELSPQSIEERLRG